MGLSEQSRYLNLTFFYDLTLKKGIEERKGYFPPIMPQGETSSSRNPPYPSVWFPKIKKRGRGGREEGWRRGRV